MFNGGGGNITNQGYDEPEWVSRMGCNWRKMAGLQLSNADTNSQAMSLAVIVEKCWCRRRDSNPHTLAGTWT